MARVLTLAFAPRRAGARAVIAPLFALAVTAHWFEHALQAVQLYALGVPPERALGALGLLFPRLVRSEWLHLVFNLAVLGGLAALCASFAGRARTWWTAALALQAWHLLEHALLFAQAQSGARFFGTDKPSSVLQLLVPRVELHLGYNGAVTALMLVAVVIALSARAADGRGGGRWRAAAGRGCGAAGVRCRRGAGLRSAP